MKIPEKNNDIYHIHIVGVSIKYSTSLKSSDFMPQVLWIMFRVNQ